MRTFTLRTFAAFPARQLSPTLELSLQNELRFAAITAQEGKQRLSQWITAGKLPAEHFFHFEGSGDFPEVRPTFLFNISFYLFPDGSICPLRIWHRPVHLGISTHQPEWIVDFNGVPGWCLVASIEPRWYSLAPRVPGNWAGASRRDWWQRTCWTLTPASQNLLPATQRLSLAPANLG